MERGDTSLPLLDYQRDRDRWASTVAAEERRFARIGLARLAVFSGAAVLAVLIVTRAGRLSPAWMLIPVVAFLALAIWHEGITRRRDRARRSLAHFERGIARLEHRWMSGGDDGTRFRDDAHLYATDLELFGPASLFQFLSTCRTETGAHRLSGWLRAPAPPEEVALRQGAVRELATRSALRHDLAVIGPDVTAHLDSAVLRAWATAPSIGFPSWSRPLAAAAAVANVVALAGWALDWWPGIGPAVAIALGLVVSSLVRSRVQAVLRDVSAPERGLVLLGALLDRVANERFEAERLRDLSARWRRSGASPGVEVRRLARLVDLVDARRNQLFAPVAGVLLLGTQLALAIEAWRQRVGPAVVEWLEAVGDLEALVALATFAFEHPADAYPEIVPGAPHLAARGLAHPLLPAEDAVRNDVALAGDCRLVVVSGSNMSGKSTLLKAIGVNLALAQAGAPVRATGFVSAPFAVGASLVLRDSLLEGRSRFYAEIVRLRDIVSCTGGERPVLFLLDELLSGTNSHDRAIGAEGVLRGLLDRGAAGFVTTHDLALTRIADRLAGRAVNLHFEDQLIEGRLVFDYRLKPGVVTRSNALELMKSVGLEV